MMLLAFFIPVFLLSINYSVKRIQSSHKLGITSSAAFAVGAAALEKYNPAKTWTTQRERIYTAGAQALCDRAFDIDKKMFMTESSTQIYYINRGYGSYSLTKMYAVLSSYGLASNFNLQTGLGGQLTTKNSLLCDDAPLDSVVFNPSKGELSFKFYSTSGGTEARNVVKYAEDSGKLAMTLDVSKKCLKCDCKCIEKVVNAYPAQCDVDIILTLPVNHAACTSSNSNSATLVAPNGTASTPVKEIANGYVEFLKNHFLHTAGVAVGVVPYSGKISIPPNRSNWTAAIPPMNRLPDLPYLKQAAVYGSDGQLGGDIVAGEYLYDDWGNPEYGSPIMFRRGQTDSYRSVQLFRGYALLSTDNPMFNTAYLFQRMNLNPCYLGHCNLLAVMCEKNCPVYRANPYFITELTDDVQNVIYDLGLIRPVDDPKNKSNFLFLAVQWAYNLLSWGGHPSSGAQSGEKFAHPARNAKKRAIILVANAPDHFEPQELTYLGFNNDNSEIPMQESDKIDFSVDYSDASQKFLDGSPHDGRIAGLKKILEYVTASGSVTRDASSGYYECAGTGKGRLIFPEKGLVKLVVEPSNTHHITFYNNNGVTQNLGTHNLETERTFTFDGYSAISGTGDYTPGPNFGSNYTINKIKYSAANVVLSADIPNGYQLLRYSSAGVDSGLAMYRDGSSFSSYYANIDDNWAIITMGIIDGYFYYATRPNDGTTYVYYSYSTSNSRNPSQDCYENSFPGGCSKLAEGKYYKTLSETCSGTNYWGARYNIIIFIKNPPGYTYLERFFVRNYYGISWGGMNRPDADINDNLCVTADGSWIKFNGDSMLKVTVTPISSSIKFTNITSSSGQTAAGPHVVSGRREFFIEASQISGQDSENGVYYLDFEMDGIRLVSAEITNRPYVLKNPYCSLSGTTNATGSSETTGTAYIKTNVRNPITLQAKVGSRCSVTFYNDKNVEDNVGINYFSTSETFNFSGPTRMYNWGHNQCNIGDYATTGGKNFGHNLSIYKLKYKLDNATISSVTLSNQILRCYAHYTNGKSDTGRKSIILNNDGHACSTTNSTAERYTDPCICTDDGNYNKSEGWQWNTASPQYAQIKAYNFYPACYGVQKVKFLMTASNPTGHGERDVTENTLSSGWKSIGTIVGGNKYNVFTSTGGPRSSEQVKVFTGRFKNQVTTVDYWTGKANADSVTTGYCQGAFNTNHGCKNCQANCGGNQRVEVSCVWKNKWHLDCECQGHCKNYRYDTFRYELNNFFFVNLENKSYSTSATFDDIIKNKYVGSLTSGGYSWLCFCGDGALSVTVSPNPAGSIGHTTPTNTTETETLTNTSYQTITIDPSSYKYEKQSDDTYKITLILRNVQIANVAMVSTLPACEYSVFSKPDNSRAVDFSKNVSGRPEYNSSQISNVKLDKISYYEYYGYWRTNANANYPYSEFFNNNILGDFYFQIEDVGSITPRLRFFNRSAGPEIFQDVKCEVYDFSGLHRRFQDAPDTRREEMASFDITDTTSGREAQYILAGFTLPLNYVLCNNGYQDATVNSDLSVAAITVDACKKLKSDIGANGRVYVIKYRTTAITADSCASGTSAPYVQTADSEAKLKEALSKIAADIKKFSDYKESYVKEH